MSLPGGGATTLAGGTAVSDGGTPDRGGGSPFQPVPAEDNHCSGIEFQCFIPGCVVRAVTRGVRRSAAERRLFGERLATTPGHRDTPPAGISPARLHAHAVRYTACGPA